MKTYLFAILTTATLMACGDDGATTPIDAAVLDGAAIDAAIDARAVDAAIDAPPIDARPSSVMVVPCAGAQIASNVTAPGFAYTITDDSITIGDVVRFTMPATHNAISGTVAGTPDGRFRVEFGQTACLRFTAAGSFPFYCGPHLFVGSITVGI